MSLKLVLISPENNLINDGLFNNEHIENFCQLIVNLHNNGIKTAIWSNRKWVVDNTALEDLLSEKTKLKIESVGIPIGMPARRLKNSVVPILKKFQVELKETILVGACEEDLIAGKNNNILLLRPAWFRNTIEYGFAVASIRDLERFCLIFGKREHNFYWEINDPEKNIYLKVLGPYSTRIVEFAGFGSDALNAAKYERGTLKFWHQLITSTLYFSGLIHEVDYITIYPGHTANSKEKAFYEVLDILGKCFGKTFYIDLITRHSDSRKSATTPHHEKTFINQLNTIYLKRHPSKYGKEPNKTPLKIKDKKVLVVDDICTNGRSLETARAYLNSAGASCVLFSWLKAINRDYHALDPLPKIDPYSKNIFQEEPNSINYAYVENIVDTDTPIELDRLLSEYKKIDI